jgi:hypothetical protein
MHKGTSKTDGTGDGYVQRCQGGLGWTGRSACAVCSRRQTDEQFHIDMLRHTGSRRITSSGLQCVRTRTPAGKLSPTVLRLFGLKDSRAHFSANTSTIC